MNIHQPPPVDSHAASTATGAQWWADGPVTTLRFMAHDTVPAGTSEGHIAQRPRWLSLECHPPHDVTLPAPHCGPPLRQRIRSMRGLVGPRPYPPDDRGAHVGEEVIS